MTITNFFTWLGNIMTVVGIVTLLYTAYKNWKSQKYYQQKLKELQTPTLDFEYVINLSGHPMKNFEDGWIENKKILDVHVGNIQNMMGLEEEAEQILSRIDDNLLKEITYGKPVIFAFPGMSSLTQILIAKVHSLSGRFPYVTLSVYKDKGWEWRKPIDLHIIRTNTRTKRWERYKNNVDEVAVTKD